jgi:hypothetical protein
MKWIYKLRDHLLYHTYYYTLHNVFYYIKVIRQFGCFTGNLRKQPGEQPIHIKCRGREWIVSRSTIHDNRKCVENLFCFAVRFRNCIFYT